VTVSGTEPRPSDPAVELRVSDGLPVLHRHARRLAGRYRGLIDEAELVSAGYVGLLEAAERFEPSFGVPFQRFAWYRIDGAMMDVVRRFTQTKSAYRETGRQAVTLLDDPGDVLRDDEHRHRAWITEYCDAVFAAMAAGVVSESTAAHGTGHGEADRGRSPTAHLLRDALAGLAPEQALLLQRHYLEGVQLKDYAREAGMSYATARRRHQEALLALGAAFRARVESGKPPQSQPAG
jgi:RNA polymerase sigma factor for flagellar operon FliA